MHYFMPGFLVVFMFTMFLNYKKYTKIAVNLLLRDVKHRFYSISNMSI